MTPEEIDYALAHSVGMPSTAADLLSFLFKDWSERQLVHDSPSDATLRVKVPVQLTIPMEAAKVHLARLMKIEARGEPTEHDLFKRP